MPDDVSQLPWTTQQWADLRAAALDAARNSRVASTFLPLVGPLPPDQTTVPANWMTVGPPTVAQPGEAAGRLQVRSGKTLHLVTVSCNVHLRGADVADPHLAVAKGLVRRAAEVVGRLEDAIVFHGRPADGDIPRFNGRTPVVQPLIYQVTGGRDLTGLLQAPDTYFYSLGENAEQRRGLRERLEGLVGADPANAVPENIRAAEEGFTDDIMCVRIDERRPEERQIVDTVVDAIQKLEGKGHFGPFAVVLGRELFSRATTPSRSLVLPTDRLAEFLDGRRVMRSGTLPPTEGVIVSLASQPVELVLARDVDLTFLQVTLEPRYVLRVFERFVLRIKELDAVCRVTTARTLLTPGFKARRADA